MEGATKQYYDVIIIGAGLSGIGAAAHLQEKCPGKTYAILEGRKQMGGTWDLFKYPGIRSDSDMYTLGYSFKPWKAAEAIADGPQILSYIQETAAERNIDEQIFYEHKVQQAAWESQTGLWTLDILQGSGERVIFTCRFMISCTGYYNYDKGYMPEFPGVANYQGELVHPQKWTEDIQYEDKDVIVIGSGATAVTLVPEMAKKARLVTMLQRSPTYIVNRPQQDKVANFLKKVLPAKLAHSLSKWKNVLTGSLFYNICRSYPDFARKLIMAGVKKELGEDHFEAKHFNPDYNPWDQRLCMVPNGDLFEAMKAGTAQIVTDHIDSFTREGIRLRSGEELKADLIVAATGLKLLFIGGIQLIVDGQVMEPSQMMAYRGTMMSNVPNLVVISGYTNASWTLKSDLSSEYACRIINELDRKQVKACIPRVNDSSLQEEPLIDFNSGYIIRDIEHFPKQGSKKPWKLFQNYPKDLFNFRYSSLKDSSLEFV